MDEIFAFPIIKPSTMITKSGLVTTIISLFRVSFFVFPLSKYLIFFSWSQNILQATVSKLPDKGERIQKQIAGLNLELDKMRMTKRIETEVIDLDDVTGKLENVLNL